MPILSKQQEAALQAIRRKLQNRKECTQNVRKDYGVKGMKWGQHKEKVDDALKCSKNTIKYAKAFVPKAGYSDADRQAIRVALNWGDREHYEQLTDKQWEGLDHALEKGKKMAGEIDEAFKKMDMEKELERLHKQLYRAQKYGNNESGDWETADKLEKEINRIEKELKSSKK